MNSTVQHDPAPPGAGAPPGAAGATQPAELRWAGAVLTLGGLLFVAGVILGLRAFGGDWDTTIGPTLPRTAAVIQGSWPEFRAIWSGELLGALLLALPAFLLQRRPQERRRWLPAAVVWLSVGIGSLLVAVSYAVTLGGYPAAPATFAEQPATALGALARRAGNPSDGRSTLRRLRPTSASASRRMIAGISRLMTSTVITSPGARRAEQLRLPAT